MPDIISVCGFDNKQSTHFDGSRQMQRHNTADTLNVHRIKVGDWMHSKTDYHLITSLIKGQAIA